MPNAFTKNNSFSSTKIYLPLFFKVPFFNFNNYSNTTSLCIYSSGLCEVFDNESIWSSVLVFSDFPVLMLHSS